MANPFQSVQIKKPNTNNFNLSHDFKYSMDMGVLTPVSLFECIPGDRFSIRTETLIRFAPLVAPVMHEINVFTHYFFVPSRIVWSNFEKFITADNLDRQNTPAWPHFTNIQFNTSTLGDYLGAPTDVPIKELSAIPFAAYQKVYNDYYRDQNLINEVPYELSDGTIGNNGNASNLTMLRRRAWAHDYFTSALPWAQKGGAVSIPIGNFNDVPIITGWEGDITRFARVDGTPMANTTAVFQTSGNLTNSGVLVNMQPDGLLARTSELEATATTINDLRRAFRLQEWLEKMARGGSRYIEQILVHFGVKSSDARLQRPEFLGGTKAPVIISEVLQTSESSETPQGTMAGHGLSANSGKTISYFCEEHGYIIGIQSVMPRASYQQGLPRHFSRSSHLDYAWPTFAHIGEQEIKRKELYYGTSDSVNNETFGYIPRYSEYRYVPSRVAGEFKTTLGFWHLGRIFEQTPFLNQTFIECNPRKDIFAVEGEQHLWCHSFHKANVRRKLPKYGTPTL